MSVSSSMKSCHLYCLCLCPIESQVICFEFLYNVGHIIGTPCTVLTKYKGSSLDFGMILYMCNIMQHLIRDDYIKCY